MLLLIDPRGAVWSADVTYGRAVARHTVDGRPLDDLPFRRAALVLDLEDYVDLALRHGVCVPRGLLLDGGWVDTVLKPGTLEAQRRNQDRVAEQLRPVERNTEDDTVRLYQRDTMLDGAQDDLNERIEKAQEDATRTLQAPPRHELIHHWRGLGGPLPASIVENLDDAE
ncbi:hypothetical protein [Micrococcus sp.]|uniref:hypothetical protein n=1 Tax=Micrococcus sp. TaxID=1271 RepID=UPI002A91AFD9|nr:hypothetical protein [Micrococcus sp.]MDY6055196.1 hypothetical protein [Micrococcus sp.]